MGLRLLQRHPRQRRPGAGARRGLALNPAPLHCALAGRCGGCPELGTPIAWQRATRAADLRARWSAAGLPPVGEIEVQGLGEQGLRDRVDLGVRRGPAGFAIGLAGLGTREIVDQPTCGQQSPALAAWVQAFRQDPPPVDRASARLRVGPDGRRGLWMDLSNVDIAALLAEGAWIRRMGAGAVVELGQRHRRALPGERAAHLGEAELHPWFQTWIAEDRPALLYGTAGGFSQVGHEANRALVRRVREEVLATGAVRWAEIGAGNGNLTLPVAAAAERVRAVELDPLALQGLARAAGEAGLEARIETVRASMHGREGPAALLGGAEALLVDPPRSGLGRFAARLAEDPGRPEHLLYVSCAGESLVADAAALHAGGYRLRALGGLDLFPHSHHAEWIARFQRR